MARACDETSITHAPQPASTIWRIRPCTSGASGVVLVAVVSRSPIRYVTVPIKPQRIPADSKIACIT
jgi:hypothetical protein